MVNKRDLILGLLPTLILIVGGAILYCNGRRSEEIKQAETTEKTEITKHAEEAKTEHEKIDQLIKISRTKPRPIPGPLPIPVPANAEPPASETGDTAHAVLGSPGCADRRAYARRLTDTARNVLAEPDRW